MPIPTPTHPRRLLTGALVAALVPLAGCGSGGGSAGGNASFDPSTVVPATAAFYGEVTVRPEGALKTSVEALARKIGRTSDPGGKLIAAIDRSMKKDGTTYRKDIEPWLGKKAAVAVTGLADPRHPDYAVIIAATDTGKALDALKQGEKGLVDRRYKGVTYSYNATRKQAAAAIGDSLTVATEGGMRSIIDVDQGAAALAKSDKLARARASVSRGGLGFFYLDPAALIDLAASSSPALGAQAGPLKGLFGGASAVGIALTAAPDAIRLETAAQVKAAPPGAGAGDAARSLADLPTGSVFAFGFGDIGARAQKGLAQLQGLGGAYAGLLGQFKTITGLDLQQDVLSWMGKGGLFVRAKGVADVGGALIVQTKDAGKTAAFISSIRALITRFGASSSLKVSPFAGAGARGFQVRTPQLPFPVIVATGGGRFVIAVGESALKEALHPTTRLGDDARFKAVATQLGLAPSLYVDVKAIVGYASLAAGSSRGFAQAKPYLDAFTALAAGSRRQGTTTKTSVVVGVG